jgi:hypothetical protein
MYKIIRKGKEEVLFIDDVNGANLLKKWSNDEHLPARLVIGKTAFLTSDIKAIEQVELTPAEKAPQHKKEDKAYTSFREKMLSLSLEERANIMRIPNMIWQSHWGNKKMTDEVKSEIKKRQLEYFKQNPKCVFANPKIYQDLIGQPRIEYGTGDFTPLNSQLPTAVLNIVQNIIQTDLTLSKK